MEQGTVINYLKDHGHATVDKLLYEIAQGLLYLHSRSIVHGDLRGSNILINEDWSACLTDFGLSIFSDATSTMSTNRGGSIYWMAPELLDPDRFGNKFGRTPASDVYAFGCVCLELYTGRPPFSNLLEPAALMKVLNGKRPERPPGPPVMSDALWKNISAYWAEKPTARPITQRVVRDMVWPPLEPKSARPRPSLLSGSLSSPSSSSMKASLGSKKRKYRWWNLRTPDDVSLLGDSASADDDSISMPWNFQHHVHVDEDLTGLPPSWAASLRAVGFSDDEIALLQRRQLPDQLHDERFPVPVAPSIYPPLSPSKRGKNEPLKHPRPVDRVTTMEEDVFRLFEESKLGSGSASLLSQALKMVTLNSPVVVDYHRKCVELQELLLVQIPWVSALAERSRIAEDLKDVNTLGAPVPTREEELLVAIRSANEQLLDALAMYDDLKRENEDRNRREAWQYATEKHQQATSSYSGSSSPPLPDSSSSSRRGDTDVTNSVRSLGKGSSPLHIVTSREVNRDSGASDVSSLVPAPRYVGWVAAAVAPLREFIDELVDPREFYWDLQEIAEGESGSVFAATLVRDAPILNLKLSLSLKARDAQQLANGRRVLVAVKSVALLPGGSAKLVAVKRECELLRGLRCEQVLGMDALYVDLVEDALWIRMELMERSLADVVGLVDEGLRLQEPRVIARFASDMLLALDFLQTHHIAHRDLRSDNLLLNSEGVLKLADFSTAVLVTPEASLCNDLAGVIYWQAPEVRSGAYDPLKIDVWSVGATVWELAEAVPPFTDTNWHAERWPALSDPKLYPPAFHEFLRLCSEPAALRPTPGTLLKTPFVQNPCDRPEIVQLLSRCMSLEQALHLDDVAPDPAPWDP
ncbi:kinase-like domain-containing protein [Mycena vitilis]|nr:kinase-like domain-containing protein [Mycena vitilis]